MIFILDILEAIPKIKLYHDLVLFHNHMVCFKIMTNITLVVIVLVVGIVIMILHQQYGHGYLKSTLLTELLFLLIISMVGQYFIMKDSPKTLFTNSTLKIEYHIQNNLKQIHQEHQRVQNGDYFEKSLILKQEHYDNEHVKDIQPPMINHKIL